MIIQKINWKTKITKNPKYAYLFKHSYLDRNIETLYGNVRKDEK